MKKVKRNLKRARPWNRGCYLTNQRWPIEQPCTWRKSLIKLKPISRQSKEHHLLYSTSTSVLLRTTSKQKQWHIPLRAAEGRQRTLSLKSKLSHLLSLSHMTVNSEMRGTSLSCPFWSWLFLRYLWKIRLAKEPWAILTQWDVQAQRQKQPFQTKDQWDILTSCMQPKCTAMLG